MSAPSPESPLDGHCSAIDNDTLYVYSSASFQALPLKQNSTWTKLSQGTAVTNPACVKVGDDANASLYVIGGSTTDASYTGLQRFSFQSQAWETLVPPTADMAGRTNHSAAYLPSANSILVYAGCRPEAPSDLSSQTFVISLSTPHIIRSFTSAAPPSNLPILVTFNSTDALLVGQATRDKELWTFNANRGWDKYPTALAQGISPAVQGLLINGTDGSKVLSTYDMSVVPNLVQGIVLQDSNGQPAPTNQTVGASGKSKRDLTLADWPAYNGTAAPDVKRSAYTVAQSTSGLVAITGGSTTDPVNLFDNTRNAWVDNGLFFHGAADDNQVPLTTSISNPTSTPTSTLAPSATTSAPPIIPGTSNKPKILRVLGITLGTLFAIAAVFIIALLLLRWRRQKKRRQQNYVNEKSDRMSFQDRGASFMKEAGGSSVDVSRIPPNHRFTEHNSSHNSFAIVAGKFGRLGNKGGANNGGRGSSESTRPLRKNDIQGPLELDRWGQDKEVVVSATGAPYIPASTIGARESQLIDPKSRSSGWSRYFAPAGADAQLPSAYNRANTTSAYTATTNRTESSRPDVPSQFPSSILVPPLDLEARYGDARMNKVASGSPSFNNSVDDLARRGSSIDAARGQTARLGGARTDRDLLTSQRRPESAHSDDSMSSRTYSTLSTNFNGSEYFAHPSSSASAWTPVSNSYDAKPQHHISTMTASTEGSPNPNDFGYSRKARAPSSNYTASYYGPDTQSRVISARGNTGFFPGTRENYRPSSRQARSPTQDTFNVRPVPVPDTVQPPKALFSGDDANASDARASGMTVFPTGVPSAYYADRWPASKDKAEPAKELPKQDMSWLNLGLK